jgi:predicted O-linked N-acetylglucosamine transferase (SPINDLY family)
MHADAIGRVNSLPSAPLQRAFSDDRQTTYACHSIERWPSSQKIFTELCPADQVLRDLAANKLPPVQPFHAMAYPFSADLALAISSKYAEFCAMTASRLALPPFAHPPAVPLALGQRLRIGYVSSDFGNHPLSHLMGSVFGGHDRSRVTSLPPPPLHTHTHTPHPRTPTEA